MARKRDNAEETEVKVSEEISNEEIRPARKRRTSKIIEEEVEEKPVEQTNSKKYVVDTDILNVRLGPGYGFKIEKQILKGTEVEISEVDSGFGKIEPGLWVDMKFLK